MSDIVSEIQRWEQDRNVRLELEDRLALQLAHTPCGDVFRPSLADKEKIGFFSADVSSQTDVSEIKEIFELTSDIKSLLKDSHQMKNDIEFATNFMKADFEKKLRVKSIELYQRSNEKISEIEKMHVERVTTVRKAFRQQLNDALVKVKAYWQKEIAKEVTAREKELAGTSGELTEKLRNLQVNVIQKDGVIALLNMQVQQLQEQQNEEEDDDQTVSDCRPRDLSSILTDDDNVNIGGTLVDSTVSVASNVEETDRSSVCSQVEIPPQSESIHSEEKESESSSRNRSRNSRISDKRTEQIASLHSKIELLENNEAKLNTDISGLNSEIVNLNQTLTEERHQLDQKHLEFSELKILSSDNMTEQSKLIERQKELLEENEKEKDRLKSSMVTSNDSLQREFSARVRESEQAGYEKAMLEAANAQRDTEARLGELLQENAALEQTLMKERTLAINKVAEMSRQEVIKSPAKVLSTLTPSHSSRLADESLKIELMNAKEEIERIQRSWEKKFAILQQSLHALKDESFLRKNMQRKAAQMHTACIGYVYDPEVIEVNEKRKLPSIPYNGNKRTPSSGKSLPMESYISYTVSAPSGGRNTAQFDENQIINDYEQIPDDIIPLPTPPINVI